jgi:hypothetical protein
MRLLTENVDGHVPENGGTWHSQFVQAVVQCDTFIWKDSMRTLWPGFEEQCSVGEIVVLECDWAWLKRYLILFSVQFVKWWFWSTIGLIAEVCLSDSVAFNYSHCRNAQLLFGVNHRIEIRLLWEIGGIWLKWCRERIELVWARYDFPLMFPFRRNSEIPFSRSHIS